MIGRRPLLGAAALLAARPARAVPARIVSVGGPITETVFALGCGDAVVAVDITSRYPRAVQSLPQIGYMRALPPEGIVAQSPDLLLLSDEAGPPQAVAVLRAARLPVAVIPDGAGPDAAPAKIRAVAAALGVDGEAVAREVAADWHALDPAIAALRRRPRVMFLLSAARGAPLASGSGTHADALIRSAGAVNAFETMQGYRPLSAEAAAALAPDAILMMEHALAEAGGIDALLGLPAVAVTPAAAARRVFGIDGSYMLGFGPRAAHARLSLARLLHAGPGDAGMAWPALPPRPWAAA